MKRVLSNSFVAAMQLIEEQKEQLLPTLLASLRKSTSDEVLKNLLGKESLALEDLTASDIIALNELQNLIVSRKSILQHVRRANAVTLPASKTSFTPRKKAGVPKPREEYLVPEEEKLRDADEKEEEAETACSKEERIKALCKRRQLSLFQ